MVLLSLSQYLLLSFARGAPLALPIEDNYEGAYFWIRQESALVCDNVYSRRWAIYAIRGKRV